MSHRSRALRGAALVLAVVALAGCAREPGAAFSVGDTSVARSRVDDTVAAFCRLAPEQARQQGQQFQPVPRSLAVSELTSELLLATIYTAYGDSVRAGYDGDQLRQQTTAARAAVRGLPADQRQAYLDFVTDSVKGTLIALAVGRKEIEKRGASAQPTDDEAQGIGTQLALRWARKQGISIDPRYNVADQVRNGVPTYGAGSDDGSLSRAVTSFGRASADSPRAARDQNAQVPPSYIARLPRDQRCGG